MQKLAAFTYVLLVIIAISISGFLIGAIFTEGKSHITELQEKIKAISKKENASEPQKDSITFVIDPPFEDVTVDSTKTNKSE